MNENIRKGLDDEIIRAIKDLSGLSPSTPEYEDVVDNIVKLYELKIDEDKSAIDSRKNFHDKIRQYIALGVETMGIVLPLIFYERWMRRGLEFEKEGTFTSTTFKGLMSKFRPVK